MPIRSKPPLDAAHRKEKWLLRVIGFFKLIKSALLVTGAVATLRLMHKNVNDLVNRWALHLHIAPGNKLLQALLEKTLTITHKQLLAAAAVLTAYAIMYGIEGIGLVRMKHWAEWMTVITTFGLVPIEIYEIFHKFNAWKIVVLVVNVAIGIYLIRQLLREHRQREARPASEP